MNHLLLSTHTKPLANGSLLPLIGFFLFCVLPAQLTSAAPQTKSTPETGAPQVKQVLLLGQSPDGHPQTTHEYMSGQRIVSKLLEPYDSLEVVIVNADSPWSEGPDRLRQADVVVLFLSEGARWMNEDPRRYQAFAQLAQRKGGLIGLHWAVGTKDARNIDPFVKLLGACHGGPDRKHGVFETQLRPAPDSHPIARGIKPLQVKEEFYYALKRDNDAEGFSSILVADIQGQPETVAWAWTRPDGGRSFGFTGLHFHENWQHEAYRRLVVQGILWASHVEIPEEGVDVDIDAKLLELP